MFFRNVQEFEREMDRRAMKGIPVGKEYDAGEADDRRLAKLEEERREIRYPDKIRCTE